MQLITKYILSGTKRRSGLKLNGVKFIVAHDTGNPGSTALQNANYYTSTPNEAEVSAHAFVDDTGVIEVVPDSEKAWHVRYTETIDNILFGGDANDYALGIELCYGGKIDNIAAYRNYVEYIASKCIKFGLKSNNIAGHFQLDPARRKDPITALNTIGKTWDQFKQDVQFAIDKSNPQPVKDDKSEKIKQAIALLQSVL